MKKLLFTAIILSLFLSFGCIQREVQKAPVIEVNFTHYVIEGHHLLKISDAKVRYIEVDKVSFKKYPDFPGIHVFGVYSKGVTPVYVLPVEVEGNLTGYVGFEKDKVPENNQSVLIVVAVRDAKGNDLAVARKVIVWQLEEKQS